MEDENQDLQNDVVVLTDENGNEKEFLIVDTFEVEDTNYAVVAPLDAEETGSDEGYIMRIDTDDEGDFLIDIEDEEEWKKVVAAYEKLVQEEEEGS